MEVPGARGSFVYLGRDGSIAGSGFLGDRVGKSKVSEVHIFGANYGGPIQRGPRYMAFK